MPLRFLAGFIFFLFASFCLAKLPGKPSFKTSSVPGFIENKGQIIDQNNKPNPAVLYLLNTPGMNVQLRKGGFSYDLYRISKIDQRNSKSEHPSSSLTSHFSPLTILHRIDIDFQNINASPAIVTSAPSKDYLNYYINSAHPEGITLVRSYQSVIYKNIYPGIDIEFKPDEQFGFKYNFIIHPGADVNSISFHVAGPEINLSPTGSLLMTTSLGVIEEKIPECYSIIADRKAMLKCSFKQISASAFGFSLDQKVSPLAGILIDPIPNRLWGTYYGGSSYDFGEGCASDQDGNVFMSGSTQSTINIATAGSFQSTLEGEDAFLVKFNSLGQRLWGTYYGGSNNERAYNCSIDKAGNIYITGMAGPGSDVATPGCFQGVCGGLDDIFLAKFNTSGMRIWSTFYGGNSYDWWSHCSVDQNCNVYLSFWTQSLDTLSTPGVYQTYVNGVPDIILAKFDSSGQRIWATYFGGEGEDWPGSCSPDNHGHVYLAGYTNSQNSIATAGAHQEVKGEGRDCFLASFDTTGQLLWATYYGGSSDEGDGYCAANLNGDVYLAGSTASLNNISTPGSHQELFGGGLEDGFLAKFDSAGTLQWGTYYGGSGWDRCMACVVDMSNHVITTGATSSTNGISTPGAYQPMLSGQGDAFITKFTPDGQRIWGTYYGGSEGDSPQDVCSDINQNIYMAGQTNSPDNIASEGANQTLYGGNSDGFLVKFEDCPVPSPAGQITGPGEICVPMTGVIYSVDTIHYATGYVWTVPVGAVITSGSNTPVITVDYGLSSISGKVTVRGVDTCSSGAARSLSITIHPRPVITISGEDTVCSGQVYVYTTQPGMSQYTWTKSAGATIISGGGLSDATVSIQWTIAGAGWLMVNYHDTNGCEALTPTNYPVTITTGPAVSVTISTPSNNVCGGSQVIFTAAPTNGGTLPSYEWKVNGTTSGTNSPTFSYYPVNGDQVFCILTSNAICSSNNPDTSNIITMQVYPPSPVSISISPSANPVCSGTSVTFTATPTNGGSSPSYMWKVNGGGVFPDAPTMAYFPANGDVVSCILTSSNTVCISNNPATSNAISMVVNPLNPVSVSINTPDNPYCQGSTVTFTATPTNGGTTPSYQWLLNGLGGWPSAPTMSYSPANGDMVSCVLNSNIVCPTGNPATSNTITMVENTVNPVSIVITTPVTTVCSGTSVIFTATPTNGGTTPGYQWKVNGVNIGANNSQFIYPPVNGDCISCILTSNLVCASGNPATSNSICMTVNPNLPVSISIITPVTTVCAGSQVTFTASPTNQGTLPQYQWKVNGLGVGTSSLTYSYIPLNGDQVSCVLTSNATCPTGNPATSNTITMTVNPNMPVSVLISASNNPVCSGVPVTYTATPTNGGTTPVYLWKVNGINAGTNSTTYQYVPVNGDLITCTLTSNLTCTSGNPATSNTITMGVAASPIVTLTRCNDSVTTTVAQPFRLKGGIPLGGTYSGPGVTNGIFYPAIAGVGSHQITYSYTNVALCSASAIVTIVTRNALPLICGNPLTDIRDNHAYPTIQIGSQCWLASNLEFGITIPETQNQRDNCIAEKYSRYASPVTRYDFYQWDELMAYDETLSTQGLCPPGWHVPSEADWNLLFGSFVSNAFAAWPLLFTGYSGFNATLSGTRHMNMTWDWSGFATMFWSSTSHGSNKAWAHGMNGTDPSVSLYPAFRSNAFSVRCLKDN